MTHSSTFFKQAVSAPRLFVCLFLWFATYAKPRVYIVITSSEPQLERVNANARGEPRLKAQIFSKDFDLKFLRGRVRSRQPLWTRCVLKNDWYSACEVCVDTWEQCGGLDYTGGGCCRDVVDECVEVDDFFWHCRPADTPL